MPCKNTHTQLTSLFLLWATAMYVCACHNWVFINDCIVLNEVFHFAKDRRCSATCLSGGVNRVLCFDKVSPVFKIVLKQSEKTVQRYARVYACAVEWFCVRVYICVFVCGFVPACVHVCVCVCVCVCASVCEIGRASCRERV